MMSLFISHVWKRFGSRLPQKSPFWITHRALQANTVDSWIYGHRIRFWLAERTSPCYFPLFSKWPWNNWGTFQNQEHNWTGILKKSQRRRALFVPAYRLGCAGNFLLENLKSCHVSVFYHMQVTWPKDKYQMLCFLNTICRTFEHGSYFCFRFRFYFYCHRYLQLHLRFQIWLQFSFRLSFSVKKLDHSRLY